MERICAGNQYRRKVRLVKRRVVAKAKHLCKDYGSDSDGHATERGHVCGSSVSGRSGAGSRWGSSRSSWGIAPGGDRRRGVGESAAACGDGPVGSTRSWNDDGDTVGGTRNNNRDAARGTRNNKSVATARNGDNDDVAARWVGNDNSSGGDDVGRAWDHRRSRRGLDLAVTDLGDGQDARLSEGLDGEGSEGEGETHVDGGSEM
jgi:hypothetical protein